MTMADEGQSSERVRRSVALRNATMDDALPLFYWRNDEDTVKWSLMSKEVDIDSHKEWLEKTLADPDRELLIGLLYDKMIGTIRFDTVKTRDDGDRIFVSITVAPAFRGFGYGKLMLEAGGLWRRDDQLTAIIHRKNKRSVGLFTSLGYADSGKHACRDFLIFTRGPLLL